MDTIQFDKCIICLNAPNELDLNSKLTEEHIVSEFIGGKLIVTNVCKYCNDRMGNLLEGPLSKNLFFRFYRYNNKILGKKGELFNPLIGNYKYKGLTLQFKHDFSIRVQPKYEIEKKEDGGISYRAYVDISDINEIPKSIHKSISRDAKNSGKTIDKNLIDKEIDKIQKKAQEKIVRVENPEVEIELSFESELMALLAIKIAYELIALKFSEIVFNEEFDIFRKSLYECKLDPNITYTDNDIYNEFSTNLSSIPFFPKENISKVNELFKRNKTLVFFLYGKCSVRIINFWFNFDLPNSLSNVFLVFSSDSKTGEHNTYTDLDFFR
ncbi:HNH endonuclease [Acinetobacter proteolyticus]|uniref:HNH endonuclease 5 domain-containing protein n=1 Tax=Acinetobacter proteolyticus TaxID=1776741 RepID=A0A2N0WBM1_9GAMM|nr:HNH endonuclease [Acinetobacter proteolyticus]PKF31904.1 hypothetical protein CW311_16855 [Acinetobacter proteolyticus]